MYSAMSCLRSLSDSLFVAFHLPLTNSRLSADFQITCHYIYRITSNLRRIQFFLWVLGKELERCTFLEFKTHLNF
jgi:hypothetical protein